MSDLDLKAVAKRLVWFKAPEDALQEKKLFLAHVMTYGTLRDLIVVLGFFSESDLDAVLDDPHRSRAGSRLRRAQRHERVRDGAVAGAESKLRALVRVQQLMSRWRGKRFCAMSHTQMC